MGDFIKKNTSEDCCTDWPDRRGHAENEECTKKLKK